jgi:hypothetical protein
MSTPDVTTQHFMQMSDVLLPPPLPLFISLLLVIGMLHLSFRGARWLAGDNLRPIEHAAAFVFTTGLFAAVLHFLALAEYASIPILRGIGWGLVGLAPFELRRWRGVSARQVIKPYFNGASWTERLGLGLAIVITIALFGAVLGPATDADSLEYHLGVPLDWLRNAGAFARPDWFHARLAGLGEAINMLGLAMGTDNLGAVFQAAGLAVAIVGVTAFATTRSDRIFGILCVVACPVMLTLVTAQKWQLFPAAGLTVALVLVVDRLRQFDHITALWVFGCAAFAAGSRYTFLLSASVVVLIGLWAAYRAGRLLSALLILMACYTFIAAPVFTRNFVFYGDPLSPMLERWKAGGDPAVIAFAEFLRKWGWELSWQRLLILPWKLAFSLEPSTLQDVFGIGVFVFLLFMRRGDSLQRLVSFAALIVFLLNLALARVTPRFFLEPYLWCAAVAVPVASSHLKSFFVRALTVQGVPVAAVAVSLGVLLFAGALTPSWRDRVMTFMAVSYAEAKWLDAVLPRDAVVLENFRYRVLMPRRFVVGERYLMVDGPKREEALVEFIKEQRVTALVTHYPFKEPLYQWLAAHYGVPLAGPEKFRVAARSVFNRRGKFSGLIVIDLNGAGLSTSQRHTSNHLSKTPPSGDPL